jgi:SAM-dependent methyltransferase
MERETRAYVRRLDYRSMAALEISGTGWTDFGFRSYRRVKWPEYDLCTDVLDDTFDVVIADQVLEHVVQPAAALRSAGAMLKPGGLLLISTPFLVRVHSLPFDGAAGRRSGSSSSLRECGFPKVETPNGETAAACARTFAAGSSTNLGTRSATSPTSPSWSGHSRERRKGAFEGEPTPGLEPGTPSLRVKCSTS